MTAPARQTALITGASSGIGADLARELAQAGYDLVLTARREDRLHRLRAEIEAQGQVRAHVVPADLAAPDGVARLIAATDALGAPIGFLANNAGFGIHGDLFDNDGDRVLQMIQLNMTALTQLTWHFGRLMRQRGGGRILQVASVAAYQPSPYYAAYAATKAYVLYLSEAANAELRGSGVTITTLCPGLTTTEFHEVAAHPKRGLVAMTAMGPRLVARIGVRGALRGKAVVTPGFINQLNAALVKLIPRSLATTLAGLLMRR